MISVPKVSVCVVTYNQEKYIRECLESLVTQECNFDFEIIVSDDCSTDNTRNIISDFSQKYSFVKPIFREKNIGAFENFVLTHQLAIGEYICHMDGDDYALPGKLQAQADFMDKTPDCNVLWHRVKILSNGVLYDDTVVYEKLPVTGFTKFDVIMGLGTSEHSSKMYRKQNKLISLPNFPVLDLYMHIEHIGNGKAYYVNDKFYGVYRESVGISSQGDNISKLQQKTLLYLVKKYPNIKQYANARMLQQVLVAIKHKRYKVLKIYLNAWIKTFHIKSFLYTFRNIQKNSLYFMSRSKKKV